MKALLINVPREAADRFFSGETSYLPCSQIPDMAIPADTRVFVCVGKEVVGWGIYFGARTSRESFANSKQDLYGLHVAWDVGDGKKDYPYDVKYLGLKRPPEEWRWIKV